MNILWLKTELLHPVDKGGKIRTYNMLRELKRNHSVTYLTLDDGSAASAAHAAANEYCNDLICVPHAQREKFTAGFYLDLMLNVASPLPYAISKYRSSEMSTQIRKQLRSGKFDVVVSDFLTPAVNMDFDVGCPKILFQHNVEAMIWKRHYEVQHNPVTKSYLYGQWLKMRSFERMMCKKFDSVITVSEEDSTHIRESYGVDAVFDVPTGVDTEFFRPSGKEKMEGHNLVFTGSMDWLPNEDAVRYFVQEIMPRIKQEVPTATLTVVGRNPFPALVQMAAKDPAIIVTGRVDDVRPYIERAAAYVVPLRIGGGTRLKIYEAMAMEKAIVSTAVGAEGLPVRNGIELVLADEPDQFASSVVKVLKDRPFASALATNAAATVREHFGWEGVANRFACLCEETLRTNRISTPIEIDHRDPQVACQQQ